MLGLIARADNRGLGQQTWAVHRNLQPAKTLVVDCFSAQPLPMHLDRFPNATVIRGLPNRDDIRQFLDGLTAVYTAETGYGYDLWDVGRDLGVTTVLHVNYEFWDHLDQPSLLAAPSLWNFHRYPNGTIHLPVPIETDRLTPTAHPAVAKRFLHVVGRPAIHDRNGTLDLLTALQYVTQPIEVTITCQLSGHVGGLINDYAIRIPDNVILNIQSGDVANYWDLYGNFDAAILPRRFGGLCLPANEAVGAGIPVIMPNIDPNNTWLPADWLTPAGYAGEFHAKQHITYYRTDPHHLVDKIHQLATDPDFYQQALTHAEKLRTDLSWQHWAPRYREVLS